ncbi:hypothetical protein MNV49_007026 [Pseudohyphozyma bogoriensis]|nr:hypothetical protein MNV49_007026 [Pseudohyphozyma bogoriensis]
MSSPYPPAGQAADYYNTGNSYGQQQQPQYQQYGGQPQQQQYAMPPTQNYAPQQPPPQQGHEKWNQQQYSQDYGNKNDKFDDMKPKWNDIIPGLVFIAQFLGFVALSVISLRAIGASEDEGGLGATGSSITLNASTAYLLAIICGAGLVFSIIMLLLVRAFTKIILEVTLLLSVVLSVAYAVYLWTQKYWSGAIIFTIFAVISVISYFPMRRRIPFSREVLVFVLKIAKHHPSVYVLALVGTILQAVYSVYWSFATVAIYQKFNPNAAGSSTSGGSASNSAVIGLVVFSVFSYYWTSQFILNFFLTVEAGIFGTYYFSGPGAPTVAWGAFKRAATYSMGSIAFGSLINAILDLLKAALQVLRQYESDQGDMCGAAVVCVAQCCLACIAGAIEYFNRIALYGKPYIKAAKDTWNLFKDRGIDALVNDCLVNNIWTFGSYAVGALCSAFAFIYLKVADPSYVQNDSSVKAVVMLYAFLVGFFISHTLGYGALSSGVSTIFVGLAEDPDALAERDPQLFQIIAQTYPKVTTRV